MTITASSSAPLAGVRVLDLTRLLPGPACTMYLADLGADVIKIEDTDLGDYASPDVRHLVQRNKRAIRINLKTDTGKQLLKELVAKSDVLVESFRTGVMDKLQVGYADLKAHNPALIFCSITGYGQTGPLANEPGHDINFCSLSGVADQIGHPDTGPALANVPVGDLLGGSMMATTGIVAALYDAQRTGQGRHVDIAIADGMLAQAILPQAIYNRTQQVARVGKTPLTGTIPAYGIYQTKDQRFIGMGAYEKKFWDAFCDVVARPDLKPHHIPSTQAEDKYVRSELTRLFSSHDFDWWQQTLEASGTCVTPILQTNEAMQHPHFIQRGMSLGESGQQYMGCPIKMTGFQFELKNQAEKPGANTEQVLLELGYEAADIARFYEENIVG